MVSWKRGTAGGQEGAGDREYLLHQSDRLNEGLLNLGDSRRAIDETNEIGSTVMTKLLSQRETIIRSTQYAGETGECQRETRSLLRAVSWSDFYTKVLMYITIMCLIVAIIFALIRRIIT